MATGRLGMTLRGSDVGRCGIVWRIAGGGAEGHGTGKHIRAGDELGEIGVEEEGADEQIPRSARREENDACAWDPVRNIPWQDGDGLTLHEGCDQSLKRGLVRPLCSWIRKAIRHKHAHGRMMALEPFEELNEDGPLGQQLNGEGGRPDFNLAVIPSRLRCCAS